MDARAHFLERQYQDAFDSLNGAYQSYCESRQRILRQDAEKQVEAKAKDRDRQVRRLVRKQEKARELIEKFEELLPQIERLVEKSKAREDAKPTTAAQTDQDSPDAESLPPDSLEPDSSADDQVPVDQASVDQASADPSTPADKDDFDPAWLEQFADLIDDRQLEFVSSRFGFRPLGEVGDVIPGAVYLMRKRGRGFLLYGRRVEGEDARLHLVDLCNAKNNIDLSFESIVKLSKKRRLVMLLSIGQR